MAIVDKSNFQVITYNKNAMTLFDHNPKLVPNLNKHETITVDTDINTLFTPFSMGLFGINVGIVINLEPTTQTEDPTLSIAWVVQSKKLMVCTTSRAQLASQLSKRHRLLIQTPFCDILTAIVIHQNSRIVDFMRYDSAALFYQGKYYPVHVSTGLNMSSLTEVGYPGAAFLGDAVCGMVAAYTASREFLFWLQSHVAKEIKWGAFELRDTYILSFTIQPVSTKYWLKGETTGFNKLHESGVNKPKANSSFIPVKDLAFWHFKEATWNDHLACHPMTDVDTTSTQAILLNNTCPLGGQPKVLLSSGEVECDLLFLVRIDEALNAGYLNGQPY
uniref:Phytochrome central region domain-containing protein n=1 Tax=Nelumbo nucifera TaxID=4432 RepID=A0A822Y7P3_NELNU|nr:TPA_asm: hypothetical protein HUJ06_028513 [Nelumbo nucifera]